MPPGRLDADSGIAHDVAAVVRDRHWADDLPRALVVVEAPEGTLGSWRLDLVRAPVAHVRERDRDRLVEVRWPARLHRDDDREVEARRELSGNPIGRDGPDADHAAHRPVVGE